MKKYWKMILAGGAAGIVTGLLGAGGGMVLVPLLEKSGEIPEEELFSAAPAILLPVCLVSLLFSGEMVSGGLLLPCLLGSFTGGLVSRKFRISPLWLHRILGGLILLGGGRLLWNGS